MCSIVPAVECHLIVAVLKDPLENFLEVALVLPIHLLTGAYFLYLD